MNPRYKNTKLCCAPTRDGTPCGKKAAQGYSRCRIHEALHALERRESATRRLVLVVAGSALISVINFSASVDQLWPKVAALLAPDDAPPSHTRGNYGYDDRYTYDYGASL